MPQDLRWGYDEQLPRDLGELAICTDLSCTGHVFSLLDKLPASTCGRYGGLAKHRKRAIFVV